MQHHASDQREVEWQFDALDLRLVDLWLKNGSGEQNLSVEFDETREISDTYLDTEDWRIKRAGYALRIRRTRGKNSTEATMKSLASETSDAPENSPKDRREISEKLDKKDPETLKAASGPVGELVRALVGPKTLRTLFEIQTCRHAYRLSYGGSVAGEVTLDETTIPLENGAEPFQLQRVEVEVEPEKISRLETFVERLKKECRLSPATVSKYETGLLARKLSPPAHTARLSPAKANREG